MSALRVATLLSFLFLPVAAGAAAAAKHAGHGLDVPGMDRSVPPGQDFFLYANGAWIARTPIPADRSSIGTFRTVQDRTDRRVRRIIEDAAAGRAGKDADARKVGDYFAAFMDAATIEKNGAAPLRPALARIAAVADKTQLAALLGSTLRADVDVLNNTDVYTPHVLGVWVAADLDQPTRYRVFLLQGGLDMPDREYYLSDSAAMKDARAKFAQHVERMLALGGIADARVRAARIVELEGRLAQSHASREETEQVAHGNNHWSRGDFDDRAPGLDWRAFFEAAGLAGQERFVVWQPDAVVGLARLVADAPIETWKDWLAFHAIDDDADVLPRAFVDARFAFHERALAGTPKLEARWKRGVTATNRALGEAIGHLYVARYFPASEKARAEALVRELLAAFDRRLEQLAWMTPQTRAKARQKLASLRVSVGYPDRWRDYSALRVSRHDAYGNRQRAQMFEYVRSLLKLGGPVDRTEWVMNPQLVNAVNLPAMNAMNFPAAILQPPFFDARRPAAMDYGAIGTIIGHEISHSFDDQGALFDDQGRLKNWWTDEDFRHFREAGEKLVAQYDAYRPLPDLSIKGRQVLSENIADLAGLSAAYDAWQRSLDGQPPPKAQGFTGAQQFFLSFAQIWRGKYREPALRQRLLTDGHSPGHWRAFTVRNLDAWYQAFPADPTRALYLAPADRVRIW